MSKRAIIGLKGAVLLPVKTNTVDAYASESTGKISLPYIGKLTKTVKESSQDIYYDDELYANVKDNKGEELELRFAEMPLKTLATLGLGAYDESKKTFDGNFTPLQKEFSLRCVTNTVSGIPFYFNYRLFTLNKLGFDSFQTKGDGTQVCEVIMGGTVTKPAMASAKPYAIYDPGTADGLAAADQWLAAAETLPGE
jgi:hypothetical protein